MAGKTAGIIAATGALLIGAASASAQTQPRVDTPALEALCTAPNAAIATEAPLPTVAATVQRKEKLVVLAIGSSSTAGMGASNPLKAYPQQLELILAKAMSGAAVDVDVVNRGVSGELAAATAKRLRTEVALVKPRLVLWQVGTNDAMAHVPVDEFVATLRDTIRWLRGHDIDVALVGLQYTQKVAKDEHYSLVRKAVADVAEAEGILLVRRYDAMQFIANANKHVELLASDDFHLNDLGYRCMAEHVARAIIVNMFVKKKDIKRALHP